MKTWILLLFFNLITGYSYTPQAGGPVKQSPPGQRPTYSIPQRWDWLSKQWTGNAKPYQDARAIIDLTGKNRNLESIAQNYKQLAAKNPGDSLSQYKWAYAYYYATISIPVSHDNGELSKAIAALSRCADPGVYEFTRLRFLLEAKEWPVGELVSIGERLLKNSPNDFEVMYRLVCVLDAGRSSDEREKAILYSNRLVSAQPASPRVYAALGWTYLTSWLKSRNSADAEQVFKAFGQYLQLAPANDKFRAQAQNLIKFVKEGMKRQ